MTDPLAEFAARGLAAQHAVDEIIAAHQSEGPDDGHTFVFSVTSRMSSSVQGEPGHHDADWWSGPITLTVRAWDLPAACRKAAEAHLREWEGLGDD